MTRRRSASLLSKCVRLATLVFYFHFAGLHNGYAYAVPFLSATQAAETVSAVGLISGRAIQAVFPQRLFGSLESSYFKIRAFGQRMESTAARAWTACASLAAIRSDRAQESAPAGISRSNEGTPALRAVHEQALAKKKEIWEKSGPRQEGAVRTGLLEGYRVPQALFEMQAFHFQPVAPEGDRGVRHRQALLPSSGDDDDQSFSATRSGMSRPRQDWPGGFFFLMNTSSLGGPR